MKLHLEASEFRLTQRRKDAKVFRESQAFAPLRLCVSLLTVLATVFTLSANAADHAAWTHLQKLPVTQTGLQRVELDPVLLDASATALGDLRLVNPAGEERPFVILTPQRPIRHVEQAANVTQRLEGAVSRFEFQSAGHEMLNEAEFRVVEADFIKPAMFEGAVDGTTWQTLAENALICRRNGFEKVTLRFAEAKWTHFRLTLDDSRSRPVVIEGVTLRGGRDAAPELPQAASILGREEKNSVTHLRIGLGAANLPLASLRLKSSEGVFQRQIRIGSTSTWFFRLQHEGRAVEDLEHTLDQSHPTRELGLIVENGDNPPLKVDSIEITRHVLPLVFQADVAGEWQLFAGNPQASAPSYDLAKMADELRRAPSTLVKAGAVEANPAFRAEAALPTTGDAGEVRLDTRGWQWRREVTPSEKGLRIFRVVLDDHALTHASASSSDLRVIAGDGVLVRHLMQRNSGTTLAAAEFKPHPDDKRPTTSRWRFKLPLAGLPVKALRLKTSSTLFERSLTAYEMEEDRRTGRMVPRQLGNVFWKSTPDAAQPEIRIELTQRPRGDEILIETDNGDNPALQLSSAQWEKPVVSLLFEANGGARPLHLLYGNAKAVSPQYDIQLVQSRFEKAAHVATQLGDVQVLEAVKPQAESHSGSPWLWAALVLVVGGLLWVVAKLLPKVESAK
jgi:hypothetical protein